MKIRKTTMPPDVEAPLEKPLKKKNLLPKEKPDAVKRKNFPPRAPKAPSNTGGGLPFFNPYGGNQ